MKLVPITEDDARFEEKQLRQPRAVADLPQVTDASALELARDWEALDAMETEAKRKKDAIKERLADDHAPDEGMTVQIGNVVISRYHRKGNIQWAKFAPRYLPADVDPEDFRAKGVEVVSARRA